MRNALITLIALIALVSVSACGKPAATDKKPAADSTALTGRPGMPGMPVKPEMSTPTPTALPADITLADEQVQHGHVAWEPAKAGTAPSVAIVPGTLLPNEDRTARLGAPAEGRVIDVRVQPGDHVTEGQLLVTLQSRDAAMAQAEVAKSTAEVAAKRAGAQYAAAARSRAERLLTLKAIPRQDFERALADDEAARAALTQAEAEQQRARSAAAQLGAATSSSGEVALRSPRAGVVLSRTASPGSVVAAGTPLVVITDPTSLWLQVSAPEQYASRFMRGESLRFSVASAPGESFTARIEAVSPGLDPETRTLAVRAAVSAGTRLKSEMLAAVEVSGSTSVTAVLLPEDAVQSLKGVATVFIAMPMGKTGIMMTRREVQTGSRSGGKIAVIGGLRAGELVVTRGAFAVRAQFEKALMPKMEM